MRYFDFADGAGFLVVHDSCRVWWVSFMSPGERWVRFEPFRASFPGWDDGFATEQQAVACAEAFVASENARAA